MDVGCSAASPRQASCETQCLIAPCYGGCPVFLLKIRRCKMCLIEQIFAIYFNNRFSNSPLKSAARIHYSTIVPGHEMVPAWMVPFSNAASLSGDALVGF